MNVFTPVTPYSAGVAISANPPIMASFGSVRESVS